MSLWPFTSPLICAWPRLWISVYRQPIYWTRSPGRTLRGILATNPRPPFHRVATVTDSRAGSGTGVQGGTVNLLLTLLLS